MNTKKHLFVMLTIMLLLAITTNPVFAGSATGLDNLSYVTRQGWVYLDQSVNVSSISNNWSDGYIDFAVTSGGDAGDQLRIQSSGSLSIVGDAVSWGGTRIGTIDPTYNGLNGQRLRINFSASLLNAGFESGDFSGWIVNNSFSGLSGDTPSGISQYSVVQTSNKYAGSYAAKLDITGQVYGYCGTAHGPELTSATFYAQAGNTLSVHWNAVQTSDYYDVYGYLVNANTSAQQQLFYERGATTNGWRETNTSVSSSVCPSGTCAMRFRFLAGTQDATCGYAVGSTLYIDGINVVTSVATDAAVDFITEHIEYQNTSDTPHTNKTYTVTMVDSSATGTATANITIAKASTSTTITSDAPDPSVFGQNYIVNVSVAAQSPSLGTPVGTVTVVDGLGGTCNATLSGGSGSCVLPSNSIGARTLSATYTGNTTGYNGSSAATVTHTVNQSGSTTNISSDLPDPSVVGQNYSVVVNVTAASPGSGTPSGTVTVTGGSNPCTVTLVNGSGSCLFSSPAQSSNFTLTASYSGDTYFLASNDSETHTINKSATATSITSDSPDPTVYGQPYTVAASVAAVAGGSGIPSGTVSISDGSVSCNFTLVNGTGSCVMPASAPGNKTLTATYSGDAAYNTSSGTSSHSISKAASSTSINADESDPSRFGENYLVSVVVAAVSPGSGTPTGTVSVGDGSHSCTVNLLNGGGSCSLPSTAAGTLELLATYGGDVNFTGSIDTEPHTISKSDSLTTIVSDNPDSSRFGQNYTVAVSVQAVAPGFGTPTGTISISDGVHNCGFTLSSGSGSCSLPSTFAEEKTLIATYSGDLNFNPSTDDEAHQVLKSETVTTILSDSPDSSRFGQVYTVEARVAAVSPGSGTPAGSVVVSDGLNECAITLAAGSGSCQLPSASVGEKQIRATYVESVNFLASTSLVEDHEVIKADSTIEITDILPITTVVGEEYEVIVEVSPVTPGNGVPGSLVTITDGAGHNCEITLAEGVGSCSLPSDATAVLTVRGDYGGDANFNSSSDLETHEIEKSDTTIVLASPYNPAYFGAPLQITATVSSVAPGTYIPDGPVQFYVNDAPYGDPIDLSSGQAASSMLPSPRGIYGVRAEYLGNTNYNPSSALSFDQSIEKAPTSVVVTSGLNPSIYGQNVMFTVTVTSISPSLAIPAGTVQFKVDGVNYGGLVNLDASGKAVRTLPFTALWPDVHDITAVYYPAADFLGSNNFAAPLEQTVLKATPIVSITPGEDPIVSGQTTSLTVKLAGSPVYIGIPTGTVTILFDGEYYAGPLTLAVDGTVILPDFSAGSGTHEFSVSYSGDDYFAMEPVVLTDPVTVEKANSLTVISDIDPMNLVVGQPTLVQIEVSAVAPGAGIPSGDVLVSNGLDDCTVTLMAGNGSCWLTPTATGEPFFSAVYEGDDDFKSSSSAEVAGPQVSKADTLFQVIGVSPNTLVVGEPANISVEMGIMAPGDGFATGTVVVSNGVDTCTITLLIGAGECTFTPSFPGQPDLELVYSGDERFNQSSDTVAGPLVSKADTSIASLIFDPSNLVVGQETTIDVLVVVDAPGAGIPSGDVVVSNGSDTCTVTLDSTGSGSCQFMPTAPGSPDLISDYSGDSNFNASTLGVAGPAVTKSETSISEFTFDPAEVVAGQPLLINVTVVVDLPGSGTPQGEVVISNGADSCTVTLVNGSGSCELIPSGVGTPNLVANYSGDLNFEASSSEIAGPLVSSAATSISVFGFDPTNLVVGQPTVVQVVVSADLPGSGVPSGAVIISNGVDQCTVTLLAGMGTCTFIPTSIGTPDLVASYGGDANYLESQLTISGPVVIAADTSIQNVIINPQTVVVGQSTLITLDVVATLPGSGTPSGTVVVTNGTESCEITLLNGSGQCELTPSAPGLPDLTLTYGSDTNFNASELIVSGPLVEKAVSINVVTSDDLASVYGQPVKFEVQISVDEPGSGTPTGLVQFYVDGALFGEPVQLIGESAESSSIADLELGGHNVWAQYLGDDNFQSSNSVTIVQQISPADTETSLMSTRNPAPYGDSVLVIATVVALDPSLAIPTGWVQFKVNGVNYGAPIPLDDNGEAQKVLPYTALWVGTHTVTAEYLGNPRFNVSDNLADPLMQVIGLADSEISFEASFNPSAFGQSVDFEVMVAAFTENFLTPSGTVTFSIDGDLLGSVMTLDAAGSAMTIAIDSLAVGVHDIEIAYSGDEQYAPKSVEFTTGHEVVKAETETSILGFSANNLVVGQTTNVRVGVDAVLPGVGTPQGTVTVSNGTDECEVMLLDGEGNCDLQVTIASPFSLTASFHESENFLASLSEEETGLLVSAADTIISTLTFLPTEVVVGQPIDVSVTVETVAPGSGVPTGSVRFELGSEYCDAQLDSNGAGTCQLVPAETGQPDLTASYPGDGNFNASSTTASPGPLVEKANAEIVDVSFSPENPVSGETMTVSVSLVAVAPGSGTPTGTLMIEINGQLCEAILTNGVATCTFNAPVTEEISVVIGYNGDSLFNGFAPATYTGPTVGAAATAIALSGSSTARTSESVQWTAIVETVIPGSGIPDGEVQFYLDGDLFGTPVILVDGVATSMSTTSLSAGAHEITAVYTGSQDYLESTSEVWTVLVNAYRFWFPIIMR